MNLGGFPVTDSGDCLRLMVAFSDEALGEAFDVCYALSAAIRGAATTSKELEVCQTQLAWWREELRRLERGEPRHPVSKAFAERIGLDEQTRGLADEWLVDTERKLYGPEPDDTLTHRIAAYRRYAPLLALPLPAPQRSDASEVIREASVALYALDAVADEPVFEYDEIQRLHDTLRPLADGCPIPSVAVIAATAANAMRRRHDGLRPGALRQLRIAWRAARRSARLQAAQDRKA